MSHSHQPIPLSGTFYHKKTEETSSNTASGISFIKSQALFLPEPVTLPYKYISLPATIPQHPKNIFQSISDIKTSSLAHQHRLNTDIFAWSERLKQWEILAEKRHLSKVRKVAPGYLDTKQRLLQPEPINPSTTL